MTYIDFLFIINQRFFFQEKGGGTIKLPPLRNVHCLTSNVTFMQDLQPYTWEVSDQIKNKWYLVNHCSKPISPEILF